MTTMKTTSEVARDLGIAEWKVRDLRKRGVLSASARTSNNVALFADKDIADARVRLANRANSAAN